MQRSGLVCSSGGGEWRRRWVERGGFPLAQLLHEVCVRCAGRSVLDPSAAHPEGFLGFHELSALACSPCTLDLDERGPREDELRHWKMNRCHGFTSRNACTRRLTADLFACDTTLIWPIPHPKAAEQLNRYSMRHEERGREVTRFIRRATPFHYPLSPKPSNLFFSDG